jgi:hypothetical protein
MLIISLKSSCWCLLLSLHSSNSITSTSFELTEYNIQKLVLTLNLNMNNEKILLQYSLKTEMSEIVTDVEKVIIVIAIENIRSEIQKSHYWMIKNLWMKKESKECSCMQVFSAWKQILDYLDFFSLAVTMKLLQDFHYETKNIKMHVCFSHLQKLEQRLRLITN